MKQYEIQTFNQDGKQVNAVYIVKPGDTLLGIKKTVKRLGGDADIPKALAPGQFVYFNSTLPRAEGLNNKILNTHELERCPFITITVKKNTSFKDTLDSQMGYKNAWIEVLALNRLSATDFVGKDVEVKIFHSGSQALTQKNSSVDTELAKFQGTAPVATVIQNNRVPASTEEKHSMTGDRLVSVGLVVLVVALFLSYRKNKKSVDLKITD